MVQECDLMDLVVWIVHAAESHREMGFTTMTDAIIQKRVSPVAKALTLTPIVSQARHRMAMISRMKPIAVNNIHR